MLPLFRHIKIVGVRGALVWGYHDAAVLGPWRIRKTGPEGQQVWMLMASVTRVEPFQIRQRPLYFSAPRYGGGQWMWGVEDVQVGGERIVARLGPPEQ